ncbi:diguanylate cyclase (GGDEF)-like protein [Desulfitispora alkaliphila]|uniref:diguanylate cyclase domain-containing protein n=1 Tax=Desulfitispora alkaliphila TaxID=622674 RepID=UPI003D25C084
MQTDTQNKFLHTIRILFFLASIITLIVTYTWKAIYPHLDNSILLGWIFSIAFLSTAISTYTSSFVRKNVVSFAYVLFYLSVLSGLYFAYVNNFDFAYTLLAIIVFFVGTLIYSTPKSLFIYNTSLLTIFSGSLYLKRSEALISPIILLIIIVIFSIVSFLIMKYKYEAQQELILSKEQIKYMAYHDYLTNIPNRNLLEDKLEAALIYSQKNHTKFGLLFIDLDKFKDINDNYGHFVGDQVLIEAANRLKEVTRSGDTVARLGGDEFIILLPSIKATDNLLEIKERINDLFKEPFIIDTENFNISPSIGMSIYPDDGTTLEEIMNTADEIMYQKKRT